MNVGKYSLLPHEYVMWNNSYILPYFSLSQCFRNVVLYFCGIMKNSWMWKNTCWMWKNWYILPHFCGILKNSWMWKNTCWMWKNWYILPHSIFLQCFPQHCSRLLKYWSMYETGTIFRNVKKYCGMWKNLYGRIHECVIVKTLPWMWINTLNYHMNM